MMIKQAEIRDKIEKTGDYQHSLALEKIQAIKDLKRGKGGPKKRVLSKIDQLGFHERMHQLYASCSIEKDMFSHYLLATEEHRKRWLEQFRFIRDFQENIILTEKCLLT